LYGDTVAVDEGFLATLGIHRLPVPVPFVEAGGPVNCFTIENEDGSFTLFDTGVNTAEGTMTVRALAAQAGVDLRRVSRIIVSHGHVDHYGNAQALAEESGARVSVHAADRTKVLGLERYTQLLERHHAYFLRLGLSEDALGTMRLKARNGLEGRVIDEARLDPLVDGQLFRFKHFEATVVHCPGHTPGLVCLHAPAHRLLFADDHLLARVSPNPLLDLSQGEGETKFLALVKYVQSAQRVRALELDCVLPGHGEAFTGHRSLIDGLLEFYARRQDKLLGWLRQKPATAYELTEALFVRRDLGRVVLMLSEVLANVEVLEQAGRVRRTLVDGRDVFQPV
jgi:glyoxylase-like metal-dependent hydrolase (beta-lactamase superfamily II)